MIFGKIDYINLLPFHIFFKKNIKSNQIKAIINHKKSYPSKINKEFNKRKIDAAFISSIESQNKKSVDFGIVAKKEVLSVLCVKGKYEKDFESATSNILAKILECEGKVIIGDKALKLYISQEKIDYIDLAKLWNEKYNLPFVFAKLCFNKHGKYLNNLTKKFNKRSLKIPQYILNDYSNKTGISKKEILYYLTKIDYKIEQKEKKSLKLFLKLANEVSRSKKLP